MQNEFTPQEFLEYLNGFLKVKSPDIVEEKNQEERQGSVAPMFPFDSLDFAASVDLVICGPCSSVMNIDDVRYINETYPMGKCTVFGKEGDRSWLHEVLERQDPKPKNVVVYATCCSWYPDRYKEMLRRLFPDITWHFPYVPDLCDNHHPDKVASSLLKAGFLKIVPAAA